MRQNLSQPGKVIEVRADKCKTIHGRNVSVPLPYVGASSLLVISDSSNNRLVILDGETYDYLESVGTGRAG